MASHPQIHHQHQHQHQFHGATPATATTTSSPLTLRLLHASLVTSSPVQFQRGECTFKADTMSRRHGSSPKLDLKLNLSPPRPIRQEESPSRSATVSPTSPPSSCVSLEINHQEDSVRKYDSSPEATSMVLVGCPRCLMYVMLSEGDPKCPRCKSTVLLDFLHDNNTNMKTRRS